jgi:hypothetical protein
MPRSTDSAVSTPTPVLPEILRAEALARIITPIIADMVTEARTRYEAAHLGRVMAEPLHAITQLVTEVRAYHGLPELTADGTELPSRLFIVSEEAPS